jgi:hypothetical protein
VDRGAPRRVRSLLVIAESEARALELAERHLLIRVYLRTAPALAIYPGALISLTVISINFVGDGLRDALDPRLRI